MSDQNDKPLVSKAGIGFDLFLASLFFLFMREVLAGHVPSEDPTAITVVSTMSSIAMTGIFWIATNMLRVTWVDYYRNRDRK